MCSFCSALIWLHPRPDHRHFLALAPDSLDHKLTPCRGLRGLGSCSGAKLTLPDSLTSAASPEDGLSAELLEAQAEEEPASPESPDCGMEAGGAPGQARLSTPDHSGL